MKKRVHTASLLLDVGRSIKTRLSAGLPLAYAQSEALRLLTEVPEPTMRTVADHFKITAPSATAIVTELVDAGLVTRTVNIRDRREVRLKLTPSGNKMLRSLTTKRSHIIADTLSVLNEDDAAQLEVLLEKILKGINTK